MLYSDLYSRESGGIWQALTASPLCCTVVGTSAKMMVVEATRRTAVVERC